jgi:hypothetical protein
MPPPDKQSAAEFSLFSSLLNSFPVTVHPGAQSWMLVASSRRTSSVFSCAVALAQGLHSSTNSQIARGGNIHRSKPGRVTPG